MKIQFSCPECGKKLAVDEIHAGKRAKCACGARVLVPEATSPEIAPPPEFTAPDTLAAATPAAAVAKEAAKNADDLGDAPFQRPGQHLDEDLIDMTAMVDIVFFILIFFLVTSLAALQAAIEMPETKPKDGNTTKTVQQFELDSNFVIVRIDADDKVWVNDSEAPMIQVVVSKLRDARKGHGGLPGPDRMLLLAHSDAHYWRIVEVLDAGAHVGFAGMQLSGDDEEEAP